MRMQQALFALGALLVLTSLCGMLPEVALAQTYRDVQSGRIASLPHEMTPQEEAIRDLIGAGHRTTPPPSEQPVRALAEFEHMKGVLIRYPLGISVQIVAEMSEDVIVYCIVTSGQQSAAHNAFQNGGVNMSHVVFFNASTDSYWTRDYGPWFAYDANEELIVIDPIYNRPRPSDDEIPAEFGVFMGWDVYGPDLITAGGNWMEDGTDIAASTTLVWDENPGKTHQQIANIVQDYMGVDTYHVVPDVNGEYIKHIDCWGKFLAVDKILIRSVPPTHSQYDEIEAAVDYWENQISAYGWPFQVYRVYTPNNQPYTNSLILNKKVLVPITGSSWDDDAILSYQQAMPGYEVLGFTGSWESTDALHCRAKGVGDPDYVYIASRPLQDVIEPVASYRVAAQIIDYSQAGLNPGQLRLYWRPGTSGSFSYETLAAIAGTDSFCADIPLQPLGTTVQYYLHAADYSGQQSDFPIVGSAGPFSFDVLVEAQGIPDGFHATGIVLAGNWPNPVQSSTTIRFTLDRDTPTRLRIFNAEGRLVHTLLDARLSQGNYSLDWDRSNGAGEAVPPGVYFYRLETARTALTRKLVVVR